MTTKAIIYVSEFNFDAFWDEADSHGVKIKSIQQDVFGSFVFDVEGDALNNSDWIEMLESNGIEVSIYTEILKLI